MCTQATALLMHALGKDRVAAGAATNDPKWLRKVVAEAAAAREAAAGEKARAAAAARSRAKKAAPGLALTGGRLDAYYATMGIPPDAYVHKTSSW